MLILSYIGITCHIIYFYGVKVGGGVNKMKKLFIFILAILLCLSASSCTYLSDIWKSGGLLDGLHNAVDSSQIQSSQTDPEDNTASQADEKNTEDNKQKEFSITQAANLEGFPTTYADDQARLDLRIITAVQDYVIYVKYIDTGKFYSYNTYGDTINYKDKEIYYYNTKSNEHKLLYTFKSSDYQDVPAVSLMDRYVVLYDYENIDGDINFGYPVILIDFSFGQPKVSINHEGPVPVDIVKCSDSSYVLVYATDYNENPNNPQEDNYEYTYYYQNFINQILNTYQTRVAEDYNPYNYSEIELLYGLYESEYNYMPHPFKGSAVWVERVDDTSKNATINLEFDPDHPTLGIVTEMDSGGLLVEFRDGTNEYDGISWDERDWSYYYISKDQLKDVYAALE